MIFKSRQVNLDPYPRVVFNPSGSGTYRMEAEFPHGVLDPRPEFEATRDPHPWCDAIGIRRSHRAGFEYEWFEPRRERFDTPVNPILVELREAVADWGDESPEGNGPFALRYERWLGYAENGAFGFEFSEQHRDHALRVLTRLVSLGNPNR